MSLYPPRRVHRGLCPLPDSPLHGESLCLHAPRGAGGRAFAPTALHTTNCSELTPFLLIRDNRSEINPPRSCMWGLPMSYIGKQASLLPPRLQTVHAPFSTKSCPRDSLTPHLPPQLTSTPRDSKGVDIQC